METKPETKTETKPVPKAAVEKYWKVQLQHMPTTVVIAADTANAWEQYKKEQGVITSEYQPVVAPATKEQYDEFIAACPKARQVVGGV